jgi:hypothetical protein
MNMVGVFSGAFITGVLGRATDQGHLGRDFAMLAVIVAAALVIQLVFLRPGTRDFTGEEPGVARGAASSAAEAAGGIID